MEKKPGVTAETLAALRDGKLSEEEREKALSEIAGDPELYEELCALEELRLAERAGLQDVPKDIEKKAHGTFSGSAGSKMAIFLTGKAVPIIAAVVCVAALIYLAVHFATRPDKTGETATATGTAAQPKKGKTGAFRKTPRRGTGSRPSGRERDRRSRERQQPRKTDPYARFQYKVPREKWSATRKLLDTDPKKLLAAFAKDNPADEVVYALAIKGKDALAQILETAGSGSDEHRARSLEILSLMAIFGNIDEKKKSSVGQVISERLASDSYDEVKSKALEALDKLRLDGKETFSILAGALGDPDEEFRAKIVEMLPRYSKEDAAHKISDLLDSDPSPAVKAACIAAAGKLGRITDEMLESIGNLMDGASDPRIRYAAVSFMKSNAPRLDDEEMKKAFDDRVFRALIAIVETDSEGEPVKPGMKTSRYTKKEVMPDVEIRITALELLVRSAGKEEKDSAETTVARLAAGSARPAIKAAAALTLDRFNRERAFELLLEAIKNVPLDEQKNEPAYSLFCGKLNSISKQSFGLSPGQQEGDYYAALEKAENWFAENRHTLTPKEEEDR
ncbi:MAG: HEAT repeat domain-containing protein [Planctomycetota bacterium]|jgi:hypothetical protein